MSPLYGQWSGLLEDHTTILLSIDPDRPGMGLAGVRFGVTQPDDVAAALFTVALQAANHEWKGSATPYRAFSKRPGANYARIAIPTSLRQLAVSISPRFASHQLDTVIKRSATEEKLTLTGLMPLHRRSLFTPMSWVEFSEWTTKQPTANEHRFLYRGHKSSHHSLLTSLHRRGFSDLLAYSARLQELAKSTYVDGGSSVQDYTRFTQTLIEVQHHGYPTPLLDWTWSPMIAAYFALSGDESDYSGFGMVFQLPHELLRDRALDLLDPRPIVSILDPEGLNVPRATIQKSVFTFSNLWDIEQWIAGAAAAIGRGTLEVIGIPKSDKSLALRDLRDQGISERTLFPDLEGACREFRTVHYGR